MVDAQLRLKTIETADIKNLIIGGQTGIDGIRFCLAAVTNGRISLIRLSLGFCNTRTRTVRVSPSA
jgi:hypothetical protein